MGCLLACEKNDEQRKICCVFKKKSQSKDGIDGIQINNALTSVTKNVTYAELAYAEEEMQKTYELPKKFQVEIPEEEFGLHARDFGTTLAIKNSLLNIFFSFIRTTANTWKNKCNDS